MKSVLKAIVPRFLVLAYRRLRSRREDRRNAKRTPEEVFSEIYHDKKWGDRGLFCSGTGSTTDSIVGPYILAIRHELQTFGKTPRPKVVDLGCGDFTVGRQLVEDCADYTGVDVVPDLIRHLQETSGSDRVRFVCLDIVKDDLPAGDICLIRQVFQHLSNDQIGRVLAKLKGYRAVYITEHHPADSSSVVPNLDKVHGGGIRLFNGSGVYFDHPPFSVPTADLELILEVPGHGFTGHPDAGVIRTYRIRFPN